MLKMIVYMLNAIFENENSRDNMLRDLLRYFIAGEEI